MRNSTLSRRMFLGTSLALGAGAFLYLNVTSRETKIYANEIQVILKASCHLFPSSKLGLGAVDLHISNYLAQVFSDKRLPQVDKDAFLKGGFWLEESSFEIFNKSFLNLNTDEKEKLLQRVSRNRWGENFIYTSLNYIIEALLSAPVYGSNIDEIGWKWLDHNAGFPQPLRIKDINYEV